MDWPSATARHSYVGSKGAAAADAGTGRRKSAGKAASAAKSGATVMMIFLVLKCV